MLRTDKLINCLSFPAALNLNDSISIIYYLEMLSTVLIFYLINAQESRSLKMGLHTYSNTETQHRIKKKKKRER